MLRRIAVSGCLAVLLSFFALPSQAATVEPLTLSGYSMDVWAPVAPAESCDSGSQLNCGAVAITLDFSGLDSRPDPETEYFDLSLTGTVHVDRTYGCENARGKRLKRYDTKVSEEAFLDTRRSFPVSVPENEDSFQAFVYAFLPDSQPGNCPSGSRAMTYKIKAKNATIVLSSYTVTIPDATYPAPGKASWKGAVPTPAPAPAPACQEVCS